MEPFLFDISKRLLAEEWEDQIPLFQEALIKLMETSQSKRLQVP